MRLAFDTSIMIAGFRSSSGASRRLLELIPQRKFQLVASNALFLEYEAVLCRQEQTNVHGLSSWEIEEFLVELAFYVERTRIFYQHRPQLSDPDDEMVLEAAINGRVDPVVTHNVRDFLPAAHHFGISVLTPGSILKERLKP